MSETLDNPMRVLAVVNSREHPEGDLEERLVGNVQTFDEMNKFFDEFDETVAIPNEGHIKYEVGSDGLVVVVVDTLELRDKALGFIDDFARR